MMTSELALLTLAVLLIASGLKGKSIPDLLAGKGETLDPSGTPLDTEPASSLTGSIANALNSVQTAGIATTTKHGLSSFDGHPVAAWIVPILKWARANGWTGTVTSGYRTFSQQESAASNYGLQHYPNGPQASNHRGIEYPSGAVDVTKPAELAEVLKGYPGKPNLVWGGPVIGDTVHFSATGH